MLASVGVFSATCASKPYDRGQHLPERKDPQEIWDDLNYLGDIIYTHRGIRVTNISSRSA